MYESGTGVAKDISIAEIGTTKPLAKGIL
jgi:hypothetical protein